MHHTNQRAHHITHRIRLADDKPVQVPAGPEGGVEVSGLGDGIGADEGLADHEDLVRVGEFAEFLERGHEARVVVSSSSSVDEDDVESVLLGVDDGVSGDVGRILSVAFFEKVDFAALTAA